MTGEAQQDVPPPLSVAVPAEESSESYLYGINDLSSILDEQQYQSSLSDATGAKSDLGTLLAESLSEPLIQPSTYQLSTMPRPTSTQRVDYPLSEPLVGAPLTHQPMSLPFLCRQSSSQDVPSVTFPAGNLAMVKLPPPRKKTRLDLRPEDSGHSSALKDPQVVVRKYADLANVADMGKLACTLARQSYFGDDVLKLSTVHGKSAQYRALNPQKFSTLLATIHELPDFREKSKQEFSLLYVHAEDNFILVTPLCEPT